MSRLVTAGAEFGTVVAEGIAGSGATIDTVLKRTGTASFKGTGSSYILPRWTGSLDRTYYVRGYYQISALPVTTFPTILDWQTSAALSIYRIDLTPNLTGGTNMVLSDAGSITFARGNKLLQAGVWYGIEAMLRVPSSGKASYEVRIDGVTEVAGLFGDFTGGSIPGQIRMGNTTANTGSITVNLDDVAVNDDQGASQNSWPGGGAVYALIPASDPGSGTNNGNWTKPSGGTTNRHTSVDNNPPIYLADSTAGADDEKMLRNAVNASSQLELVLQSYTAAGVPASQDVELVQPAAETGSSSATDTTGSLEATANPVVAAATLSTFDNGVASATQSTWPRANGSVSYRPTVTRGTGPTLRLTRDASAQTVMTNMIGMTVEVSPTSKNEVEVSPATVRHGWF